MSVETVRVCRVCQIEKPISSFPVGGNSRNRLPGYKCSACAAESTRRRLRLEFLKAFDFKCSCCGETHIYFLSLEHKAGRPQGRRSSMYSLQQARADNWDKTKYECLCFNCNCAKGFYGECPHRSGVSTEEALQQLIEEASYHPSDRHQGWPKGVPRGPQTEEQKAKTSELLKGKAKSPEAVQHMIEAWQTKRNRRLGPGYGGQEQGDPKDRLKALGITDEQIAKLLEQMFKS